MSSSRTSTLVAIFVAAACMRTAITAVGPLLHEIGHDTGMSNTELGLLSALPLLAFAAVSPVVHRPSRRLGAERLVTYALAVLAVGILVRSLPALAPLWIGTALLGGAVAVCNVVLPSMVKRDFADRVTLATGGYTAVMGAFAALASGVALPIADAIGDGWRWSLVVWAAPAALAALAWRRRTTRTTRTTRTAGPTPRPDARATASDRSPTHAPRDSVWRSRSAWSITIFMGFQSTCFYVFVSWLPAIATSHHTSSSAAGWYLFLYQLIGLLAGLALPLVIGRTDTRRAAAVVGVPLIVAVIGLVGAPVLLPLWVVLAGVSSGASLVAALSLMSLESADPTRATQLSGMAQSIGYLIAAGGPVAAGWLRDTTGSWTAPLVLLAVITVAQSAAALLGRIRPAAVRLGR